MCISRVPYSESSVAIGQSGNSSNFLASSCEVIGLFTFANASVLVPIIFAGAGYIFSTETFGMFSFVVFQCEFFVFHLCLFCLFRPTKLNSAPSESTQQNEWYQTVFLRHHHTLEFSDLFIYYLFQSSMLFRC